MHAHATGLRPIANLGGATVVKVRGCGRRVALQGQKRARRRGPAQLTFRPVNQQLRHLHQVPRPPLYRTVLFYCLS